MCSYNTRTLYCGHIEFMHEFNRGKTGMIHFLLHTLTTPHHTDVYQFPQELTTIQVQIRKGKPTKENFKE